MAGGRVPGGAYGTRSPALTLGAPGHHPHRSRYDAEQSEGLRHLTAQVKIGELEMGRARHR